MNGSIMGMRKYEIDRKLDEIVDFSGCERYLDTPVKRYSSGMTVRLGFAIAAHLEPDILVVDEVLAVGDAEFQKKAVGKMHEVSQGAGRTVLFVSHNMRAVRSLCKSGIVLKNGMVEFAGTADACVDYYVKNSDFDKVNRACVADLPRERFITGRLKFTNVRFLDDNNEDSIPVCGGCIKIYLDFDVKDDSLRSRISVGVRSSSGDVLLSFPSDVIQENFVFCKGHHVVVMRIPRLPLTQGVYNIALSAGVDGETYDWLECARQMNVEDGDFYGTGRMLGSWCQGKVVLCDYEWEIVR
jgi:lipopolysaccharide transport system ATP-binding protein